MTRYVFESKKLRGIDKKYSMKFNTPESLVKYLLSLFPFEKNDFVLDAGSGKNKVWYNNIPTKYKDEVEILEGKDFLKYDKKVDWVVGNPPYTQLIDFYFKASDISRKGFGFMLNHSRLNQLTPHRLSKLYDKGFYPSKFVIYSVKDWFGRYYFILFTKDNNNIIIWSKKTYS